MTEFGLGSALIALEAAKESIQVDYDRADDSIERDYISDNIQRIEHAIKVIKKEMAKIEINSTSRNS